MKLKAKKGYSLIEIAVGILILTIFLICSAALFNGCYNTYRMIQQRNLAINLAVSNMESLLQTDSDVLTGFFVEDPSGDNYIVNSEFESYVIDNFESKFKSRYASLNNVNVASVAGLSTEEYEEYILKDSEYLISSYVGDEVSDLTNEELDSEEVKNGDYALLVSSIQESGNEALLYPGVGTPSIIQGEMAIRKTISRLPLTENNAYGNKILKIKVEVLYTNKVNTADLTDKDVNVITLESVKIDN